MRRIVSHAVEIMRKPEEVFAVAADPASQLVWQPERLSEIESLNGGPPRLGARYRGKYAGKWVEFDFTEFDPPRALVHRTRIMGRDLYHRWEITPTATGARLETSLEGEPHAFMRLMLPLMRGRLERSLAGVGAALKRYLESK